MKEKVDEIPLMSEGNNKWKQRKMVRVERLERFKECVN